MSCHEHNNDTLGEIKPKCIQNYNFEPKLLR